MPEPAAVPESTEQKLLGELQRALMKFMDTLAFTPSSVPGAIEKGLDDAYKNGRMVLADVEAYRKSKEPSAEGDGKQALQVIQAALDESSKQYMSGIIGLSPAKTIHDALRREHLLAEGDGWIAVTPETMPEANKLVQTYHEDGGVFAGYWHPYQGEPQWWCEETLLRGVLKWKPMSTPPVAKEGRES